MDFFAKPFIRPAGTRGVSRFCWTNRRIAKNIFCAHPRWRMEAENFPGGGIGLLYYPIAPEYQDARRKVRKHSLAEIFCSAGPALLRLILQLQFVLLLLQLLNDGVIQMKRQSFEAGRGAGTQFCLFSNTAAESAHSPNRDQEGGSGGDKREHRPQHQRIGEQPYHQSLPYQFKNSLPTKNATSAMLPRNTPKGIW